MARLLFEVVLGLAAVFARGQGSRDKTAPLRRRKPPVVPVVPEAAWLLVGVLSSPGNVDRRDAIRRTWMRHGDRRAATWFVVGARDQAPALRAEADARGDLLLLDVAEAYHGVSKKVEAFFECAARHRQFAYVAKVDDDTYVRLPEFIERLEAAPRSKVYMGAPNLRGKVLRDRKHFQADKFYTSREEWAPDSFPPYMQGGAYVLSADVAAHAVARAAERRGPAFKFEDVNVGMLLRDWTERGALDLTSEPRMLPWGAREGQLRADFLTCHYAGRGRETIKGPSGYDMADLEAFVEARSEARHS